MYIANYNGEFLIKRMPNTGHEHSLQCDSFEPPAEISGLSDVVGTAIQEDPTTGEICLKLEFSLKKGPGKVQPAPSEKKPDSVKANDKKLTLLAALEFFWEEAQLNKWVPQMSGKRNWNVIRRNILLAASKVKSKGKIIGEVLYIPEMFFLDRKIEISNRRLALLSKVSRQQGATKQLLLLIGEVKGFSESPLGKRLIVKHAPDYNFIVADDLFIRLNKRYLTELSAIGIDGIHVMVIATFSLNYKMVPTIEEMSLMLVSEEWLPFENEYEHNLVDLMVKSGRRFIKGLRYLQAFTKPMASCLLTDLGTGPVALYIVPSDADGDYLNALDEIIKDSSYQSWVWNVDQIQMPSLPENITEDAGKLGLFEK